MSSDVIQFTPLQQELGLIHAYGPDAEKFLQGQFSNDLRTLTSGQGQWSSYSTAKGRMIANFYVQRAKNDFWLSLSADMADAVIERLRKFRMMAKLEIERGEPSFGILSVYGTGAKSMLEKALKIVLPDTPNGGVVEDGFILTRLPWTNREMFQIISSSESLQTLSTHLQDAGAVAASSESWRLQAIQAGVAFITAITSEKVIPQELNLEVLGGINFKKGCYPGQEIVARSHYLGKLKNQMYAVSATTALQPGAEIFCPSMGSQNIGLIINVAPDTTGGHAALAVLRAANAAETLTVGSPDGAELHIEKMPYTLPLDIVQEA
ncbi:MAG: folate-binding protein [Acidithiobacillus sp.]